MMRYNVFKRFEGVWESNCQKLIAFREEFGHCAVPRRWKRDMNLSQWVMRQVRKQKGSGGSLWFP
jgi:hypothetical protein